jgi:hypothetical protein
MDRARAVPTESAATGRGPRRGPRDASQGDGVVARPLEGREAPALA